MAALKGLACGLAALALVAAGCIGASSPDLSAPTDLVAPSGKILLPPCPASAGCLEGFVVGRTPYGISCHGVETTAVDDEVVARGEGKYQEARLIEGIPPELWLAVRGDLPCHPENGRPLLYEWYLASGDLTPADLERWGTRVTNVTLPLDPESAPDGSP